MHRSFLFFLLVLMGFTSSAQLEENFDNNDLSKWSGDINDFIINDDFQLQLMAENEGQSTLYTPVSFPDSLTWNIDVKLSFSPSNSNLLRILLAIDNMDLSIANGYMLELGETGSDDAINFIQLDNGNSLVIASGVMGNVSSAFNFTFSLKKSSDDNWILNTRNIDSGISTQEFEFFLEDSLLKNMRFFGFDCIYTSSRKDKFAFDNIEIKEILPDITGPVVNSVKIINSTKLHLTFNELLDSASAKNTSNYSLNSEINIDEIIFEDFELPELCVILSESLPSGQTLELNISGVKDVLGNEMTPQSIPISLIEEALPGDLLINEILFDPYPDGDDFVEIINASEKTINLEGFIIRNANKPEEKVITRQLLIKSGEIIAFSPDPESLIDIYLPPANATIVNQEIPSFNNADGNVSLISNYSGTEEIIDAFDYDEDFHFELLSDTEGVSLERVSIISDTNNRDNWFSSASTNLYATPGYENSSRVVSQSPGEEAISLEYKVFSPDADGYKDLLIINYNLPEAGYLANITLYDDHGRFEKHLSQSELLSTQGILTWDGILGNGQVGPVGMYIIYYELFHPGGQVISGKKVCVLAQQLN